MTITKIHKHLYKLESNPGYIFALKDKSAIFGNVLYVPSKDRAKAFIEILINAEITI